jgi:hypothetical protein
MENTEFPYGTFSVPKYRFITIVESLRLALASTSKTGFTNGAME